MIISKLQLNYSFIGKLIFLYPLFFLLFYLEPISVGGLKFAIIWKLPIVIFLGIYFYLKISKTKKLPIFVIVGLLLTVKILFSLSSFNYFGSTISEFTKLIIFFFLFVYFNYRYSVVKLENLAIHISIFIVLSFLPFMFGLLKPLGKNIELNRYGNINFNSLTGIFQNPHAAGISLAIALIVIYYFFLKNPLLKEKIILGVLLLIGFYEISLTFVRTPILMLMVGMFILSKKYFRLKHYMSFLIIVSLGTFYVYTKYESSPLLQSLAMRAQGDNVYHSTGGIGSGRLMFWNQAIENWHSEGIPGITFGLGIELAKDKMYEGIGLRLFAHNGFLQQLQADGVIGLILLILFIYLLYKYINKYKKSPYYVLAIAIFSQYIIYMFFQGGNYFLFYVMFTIYLAILPKTMSERK